MRNLLTHRLRSASLIVAALVGLIELKAKAGERMILAGGNELFVIDTTPAANGTVTKLWRWSGDDAPGLSEAERKAFNHLDECKPVAGGRKVLVSASNGGCALIERASGRILWRARVTNAHSVELLPRDRVIVASSLGGNHLVLFDLAKSDEPIWTTPLHSAHGLVWDEARRCLWALGFDELRRYELKDWETKTPSLELKATHKLPSDDGHDLRAVPNSTDLLVTTEKSVHLYDREKAAFRPHPLLGESGKLKSVDVHPASGRIVVSDWSTVIFLRSPDAQFQVKPNRPYKARWLVEWTHP